MCVVSSLALVDVPLACCFVFISEDGSGLRRSWADGMVGLPVSFMCTVLLFILFCIKAINNGSACSVLFLSSTGLFPAHRKIL